MNRFTKALDTAQEKIERAEAKALLAAANATGRLMNTKVGKAMLVVPSAITACTITASAEDATAQGMIDGIMGILGPGVIGLGTLVAIVGGIQTGVGFKDDNADGKTRGFQTLIGGAIIAAVGALVPSTISLGG